MIVHRFVFVSRNVILCRGKEFLVNIWIYKDASQHWPPFHLSKCPFVSLVSAFKGLLEARGRYFTINSYGGVRRKDFCYDPIPEIWSDIDIQSQNVDEVTKTVRRQRDKGSRAGNDNFCPKWPLEQSSDLSTFLNTKNT